MSASIDSVVPLVGSPRRFLGSSLGLPILMLVMLAISVPVMAQQLEAPASRPGEADLRLVQRLELESTNGAADAVPRLVWEPRSPGAGSETTELALPLAPGARVSDLRRHGESWWVAAVESARGEKSARRGHALVILAGVAQEVERLAPPAPAAPLVREPVLLTDRRGLRALLWLEGPDIRRLALRTARWGGESWLPAETLSPAGEGTQIALDAATLDDGSQLVVWSAFDGEDDEILWSRATAGRWSRPQRLAANNRVPDITPSLIAVPGGALVAWSRYEGGSYRTFTSVLGLAEGKEGWSLPMKVIPEATVFPSFLPQASSAVPVLALHHPAPAGWSLLELSTEGLPTRGASLEIAYDQAPRLVERDALGLVVAWDREGGNTMHRLTWAASD